MVFSNCKTENNQSRFGELKSKLVFSMNYGYEWNLLRESGNIIDLGWD